METQQLQGSEELKQAEKNVTIEEIREDVGTVQSLNSLPVRQYTFDEYQERALKTAIYPGSGTMMGLAYTALGLGESGEIQGKVKKIMRDNGGIVSEQVKKEIGKEIGDQLWYLAATAKELGLSLGQIAKENIEKLESRQSRGVLGGSGDGR